MISFHTSHLTLGNTSFCGYANTLAFLWSLELFPFPLLKPVQRHIFLLGNFSSWKPSSNWAHLSPQHLVPSWMHSFLFIRRDFLAAKYRFSNRLAGIPDAGHSCPSQPWVSLHSGGSPKGTSETGIPFRIKEGAETELSLTVNTNTFKIYLALEVSVLWCAKKRMWVLVPFLTKFSY